MKKTYLYLITGVLLFGMVGIAHATPCSSSDVQLNGQNADACSGPIGGNENNPQQFASSLNNYFSGNEFSFVAKDESSSDTGSVTGSYGGITFTLRASGASSGKWYLSWSGAVLPATIDLVVLLKSGDQWDAYLFDNELLQANGSNGTGGDPWEITFSNGNSPNPGDLSHFSLYARDVQQQQVPPVPEPGTMVLLGAGMLGLAIFGKRRMNKE